MYNNPTQILDLKIESSISKARLKIKKLFYLGLLAGAYIAIGALAAGMLQAAGLDISPSITTIMAAVTFCIGIVSVILAGAELFTGDNLMVIGMLAKKITLTNLLKTWFFVYVFNFIGSLAIVFLAKFTGILTPAAQEVFIGKALAKMDLTFNQALLRGIGCNFLVCLSVWISSSAKDAIGIMFTASFPVFVFIILGFEHCVANMFYIPLAQVLGANISILDATIHSFIPVTIGNIIGGSIIGIMYYIALRD
ncbi:MAG: formate/nitrite transporter family protein [Tissierellia bacterium]|nr:formate/nitrite transporter family protein [Tissierellia bacterium]